MSETETISKTKPTKANEEKWKRILKDLVISLQTLEKKKGIVIQNGATQLEEAGMPLNMISAAITDAVKDFISSAYVRESLGEKYKMVSKSRKISATSGANVSKNVTEQAPKKDTKNTGKALPPEETGDDNNNEESQEIYQIPVKDYSPHDAEKYDRQYLIAVSRYLYTQLQLAHEHIGELEKRLQNTEKRIQELEK